MLALVLCIWIDCS